jgi:predicted GNAT family acetyltransferase
MGPGQKTQPELSVTHNREQHRFEIPLGAELAMLQYRQHDDSIDLMHTEVPQSHQAQGLADKLAKAALDYAKQNQLKVIPSCRFVRAYLKRHPDAA